MIQRIFTIFDEKANAYLPPFFLPTSGMAVRTFTTCLRSPDHQFGLHPEDYTLFDLGAFDDNTAQIDLSAGTKMIGNGVMFLEPTHTPDLPDGQKTTLEHDAPVLSGAESGNSA